MKDLKALFAAALLCALSGTHVMADCQIADTKLEEAILQKPELRGPANRQTVRDLRSLRDAAFTLWSYGRHADCERLMANIRELISGPSMSSLGDNDEDAAGGSDGRKRSEGAARRFSWPARGEECEAAHQHR